MYKIVVSGTPYEIGQKIGEHFQSQIKDYITYRQDALLKDLKEIGICVALSQIQDTIMSMINSNIPNESTIAELKGVSAAAGVALSDIFIGIGYTDVLDYCITTFSKNTFTNASADNRFQECSTFVIKKQNKLYIGQNWDMDPISAANMCLFIKKYKNGTSILSISTILGLTHIGMNDKGVCVGTANLRAIQNSCGMVFPQIIQASLLMKSSPQVYRAIRTMPRMAGHYYYIGFSNNDFLLVETTSSAVIKIEVEKTENCYFAHTNHYLCRELLDTAISYSESSERRLLSLHSILAQQMQLFNFGSFLADLGDHDLGLCRHNNELDPLDTCASVVFIPSENTMYLCDGHPCTGDWQKYDMKLYI